MEKTMVSELQWIITPSGQVLRLLYIIFISYAVSLQIASLVQSMLIAMAAGDASQTTVDVEGFAGLNIRGFSPIKFFVEVPSWCIGHQYSLLTYKNSRENFRVELKNCENHESLVQRIFPCLWYTSTNYICIYVVMLCSSTNWTQHVQFWFL